MINCTFTNCISNGDGGAIYSNSSLTVDGCNFVDCAMEDASWGYYGSAICSRDSSLTVDGCSFINCTVRLCNMKLCDVMWCEVM